MESVFEMDNTSWIIVDSIDQHGSIAGGETNVHDTLVGIRDYCPKDCWYSEHKQNNCDKTFFHLFSSIFILYPFP